VGGHHDSEGQARPARIGCSGWSYEDWEGVLYPPRLPARERLRRYAEVFDTVEVNATFYRLQSPDTTARWAAETPDGFLFAVKASRYLTHVRRLRDAGTGVARLLDSIAPLAEAGKLGPLLWQLPGDFRRDDDRLAGLLAVLPGGRHCFEFRHESWHCAPVLDLLRAHHAALVVADRGGRAPGPLELTTDWTYVRFHGGEDPSGCYSDAELRAWAARIRDWRRSADVQAYFNNDWQGFAVRNAESLRALLGMDAAAPG
jgi:uncharacterized protein YecE (DUF72 family)